MCVAVSPIFFFNFFFFGQILFFSILMKQTNAQCSGRKFIVPSWLRVRNSDVVVLIVIIEASVKKPVCVCSSFVVSITHCLSSQQPSFPTPLLRSNRLPKTLIFTPTHFTILFRSLCHLSSEAGKIGF